VNPRPFPIPPLLQLLSTAQMQTWQYELIKKLEEGSVDALYFRSVVDGAEGGGAVDCEGGLGTASS